MKTLKYFTLMLLIMSCSSNPRTTLLENFDDSASDIDYTLNGSVSIVNQSVRFSNPGIVSTSANSLSVPLPSLESDSAIYINARFKSSERVTVLYARLFDASRNVIDMYVQAVNQENTWEDYICRFRTGARNPAFIEFTYFEGSGTIDLDDLQITFGTQRENDLNVALVSSSRIFLDFDSTTAGRLALSETPPNQVFYGLWGANTLGANEIQYYDLEYRQRRGIDILMSQAGFPASDGTLSLLNRGAVAANLNFAVDGNTNSVTSTTINSTQFQGVLDNYLASFPLRIPDFNDSSILRRIDSRYLFLNYDLDADFPESVLANSRLQDFRNRLSTEGINLNNIGIIGPFSNTYNLIDASSLTFGGSYIFGGAAGATDAIDYMRSPPLAYCFINLEAGLGELPTTTVILKSRFRSCIANNFNWFALRSDFFPAPMTGFEWWTFNPTSSSTDLSLMKEEMSQLWNQLNTNQRGVDQDSSEAIRLISNENHPLEIKLTRNTSDSNRYKMLINNPSNRPISRNLCFSFPHGSNSNWSSPTVSFSERDFFESLVIWWRDIFLDTCPARGNRKIINVDLEAHEHLVFDIQVRN